MTSGPGDEAPGAWTADLRALILDGRFAEADTLLQEHEGDGPSPVRLELALRQRWGMALLEQGQVVAAEAQLRRAAELAPQDAEAQADLAFAQLRCGRAMEAIGTLQRTLALDPNHRGALSNLGAALMATGQPAAAEGVFRSLLAADPKHATTQRNLGEVLNMLERHDEALAHAEAILAGGPSSMAHQLRAASLVGLQRFEEAVDACRRAISVGGDPYEPLARMGQALAALGRMDEASAAFDQAVARRPQAHQAYYWRSLVRLKAHDFQAGWQDYEARWRDDSFRLNGAGPAARSLAGALRLNARPDDLAGRRVLVVGEQGIGDEIMFASMLPDLARVAARVTCICERRLAGLFAASLPEVTFVPWTDGGVAVGDHEVVIPAGSLGRLFRNQPEDFPGAPFLRPSPDAVARWAERLGPKTDGVARIGVSWRGGTSRTRLSQRSIPLDELVAALQGPAREFVSLQYGDPRDEVAAVNARLGAAVRTFDPRDIEDFHDLGGLVANLDAVVSVQTALVHLCGAMGANCLTLVPPVAEWRYGAAGAAMPWYGSVRLFRRQPGEGWSAALSRVAAALEP